MARWFRTLLLPARLALIAGWLMPTWAEAQDGASTLPSAEPPSPPLSAPGSSAHDLPSAAASCDAERYLVLSSDASVPAEFAREIRTDLAAELVRRGIGLCTTEQAEQPALALVQLRQSEALLQIELDDRATHKRVARDLRLGGIPQTGRALAVAIAIDELLRASWAELTMLPSSPEPEIPPPLPRRAEAPFTPPRAARAPVRRYALSGVVSYTHGAESWNAFAGGVSFSAWPREWLWLQLELAGLRSLAVRRAGAELHARGAQASALVGVCPWRSERLFACAGAAPGLDALAFRAHADGAHVGTHDRTGVGLRFEGVLALGVKLRQRWLLLPQTGFGGSPVALRASDGQRTLSGTGGFLWSAKLAVGVLL